MHRNKTIFIISFIILFLLAVTTVLSKKYIWPSSTASFNFSSKNNKADSVNHKIETAKCGENYFAPILVFHHIGEPPMATDNRARGLYVNQQEFETIIKELQANGYQPVFVSEMLEYLNTGHKAPSNWVALTFDDGYADYYDNAWPILKKYNIKSSLYVITGYTADIPGTNDFLASGQITELDQSGLVEIGSHSVSHLVLTQLTPGKLLAELKDSKQYLEKLLNKNINTLCYPFGSYNLLVEGTVKLAGYQYALGYNHKPLKDTDNMLEINRASVWSGMNVINFLKNITEKNNHN